MSKFNSLEVVACVRPGDPQNGLVKGNHYTIYRCFVDASDNDAVELIELDPPYPLKGFLEYRFEKLVGDEAKVEKLEETI
ncbi:MAG: hypothetical protein ACJAVA_000231 [Flavobacteriaceae bacterium]|jgi:hypothetical protein